MLRRIVASVAAVAGLLTVTAAPAAAATVTVDYLCGVVGMVVPRTFTITITLPATVSRGVPVTVTGTVISEVALSSPQEAGSYQGVHDLLLEGAATGEFRISPMSSPPFEVGDRWGFTGSSQITFNTAGTVSFRPEYVGISRPGPAGCMPRYPNTVPVVATTQVR